MTARRGLTRVVASMAGALLLVLSTGTSAHAQSASAPELKAAFLLNFAKFTNWTNVQSGAPVVLCVLDDDRVGAALLESVRGQVIDGHKLEVWRLKVDTSLPACHLVFAPGSDPRKVLTKIGPVKELPVLTVSDARGFAEAGGMIELFEENGRMRFAVNMETVQKSGVRLSSRLLDLAKIIKSDHAH